MSELILITGGAGFIGRHLARTLLGKGHRVRVLDSLIEQVHGSDDKRPSLDRLARASTAESTLRRMEAIVAAREALEANAAPLLTLEAMALTLREG